VEANGLSVELDDVAEDQDGLAVEDDGGVGGMGAVFAWREPVGGGVVWVLFGGEEEGIVGPVDVEEVAFVGDEGEVAELVVEGRGIAFGFVVAEEGEETVFATLEVGLFALQEGVAEGSVRDEAEDAESGEGDEEIPQHEPGTYGEGAHARLGGDEHVTGAVDGADEGAAVGVVF
jgi:hypothetical protein